MGVEEETQNNILVVDDTPVNLEVLCQLLGAEGYNVRPVLDGATALIAAAHQPPDLFLLDIHMPGMDGYELCQRIKADDRLRDIPVIFISALSELKDKVRAFDVGGVDYVSKPFDSKEVLARVRVHSDLHKARQQLQKYASRLKIELDRIATDQEAGRRVQFALLPDDNIMMAGCGFRRLLMPSMYMSGDFVDYFEVDGETAIFYAVDVAGHGAASALITALVHSCVHHALENYKSGTDSALMDPGRLLQQLNTQFLNDQLGRHLAIFYGIIRTGESKITYANGGYFPYPLLRSNGNTAVIQDKSPPVGLFANATYRSATITLPAEFDLILFSDGILEVMPENNLQNQLAHLRMLCDNHDLSPENISLSLGLDQLESLPDDITILSIQRRI